MGGKAILILVMGFAMILGYVALNLNTMATQTIGNMSDYNNATSSHNLANAGANAGLAKFYQDTSWRGPLTQSFSSPSPFRGSFTAKIHELTGNRLMLRSVSTYPVSYFRNINDTIEVYFDRTRYQSFSLFAWMTNVENSVNWITGDTVWGKVHSNSTLVVNGRPVFYEKVTTTKSFSPKPGKSPNNAIFKKGYETGVQPIEFPTNFSQLVDSSLSGGRNYAGSIWVTLDPGTASSGDGFALVRATKTGPIIDTIRFNGSFNGALVASGRLNIQGTLDGRLTACSLSDVYIQDDVVLAANPLQTTSDDMLGIVAENNIVVADNAANNSHCAIQACVFTRNGSFMAENYNTRPVSGELRLIGSIVQNIRGAVGTFSGSTIQSGFSKRYRYDPRLFDPSVRPPFFPGFYVKTYAITNWWESYRLPSVN